MYAAQVYRTQTFGWENRFRRLVARVNRVAKPTRVTFLPVSIWPIPRFLARVSASRVLCL